MPDSLDRPLGTYFRSQVELHPDRLAVKADDARFTYAELNRQANRIAHAILHLGGPGKQPVALLFDPGTWMAAAILGAVKAGRPYVPLEPDYPATRIQATLQDCGAGLILTAGGLDAREHGLRTLAVDGIDASACDAEPAVEVGVDDTLVMLYTSGSTGTPKAVAHSHRNILFDTERQTRDLALTADDGVALFFSPVFSASLSPIFGALLNGAALYPFRLKQRGLADAAALLHREPITICDMTVSMFRHFCAGLAEGARFANPRLVSVGGEPVWAGDIRTFREHFSPDCILQVTLASTECRVVAQYFIDRNTVIAEGQAPVGYPVAGKHLMILDGEGREVARGQAGEIAIRSRYIAAGNGHNGNGERTFRTGDLGRQNHDGLLMHLGRRDDQVKVRGYRIATGEIEGALMKLEEVREAAVAAWSADAGDSMLAAYVVAAPGMTPSPQFLRDALATRLPAYMVPAAFVNLDRLPLTATGKVDRRALPPIPADGWRQAALRPPQDEFQARVCRIWEEVLGVSPIGIDDDFFAIGGHSLLAIRMLDRVASEGGQPAPVELLFRHTTVAKLCAALEDVRAGGKTSPLLAFGTDGKKLPFFFVHGDPGLGGLYTRHLPAYLGADQPLYLFPTHGLDENGALPSVEEMAADNLALLRDARPRGPYLLGGYCNGGLIAFEMARQLTAAGERVDLMVIVHIRAVSKQLRSAAKRFPQLFDGKARLDPSYPLEDPVELHQLEPGRRRRINAMQTSILKAIADYTPGPYPGRVTLLWPDESAKVLNDPAAGWSEIAAAVDVRPIRGNHISCTTEHLGTFGATLRECLDEAQRTGDR